MVHHTVLKFYELIRMFECETIMEIHDSGVCLKLVPYENFEAGFETKFGGYACEFESAVGLAFAIFIPSFEVSYVSIVVDSTGRIFKMTKRSIRLVAPDIFTYLKKFKISFKNQQDISSLFKIYPQKFHFADNMHLSFYKNIFDSALKNSRFLNINGIANKWHQNDEHEKLDIKFTLDDINFESTLEEHQFEPGTDRTFTAFNFVNADLSKQGLQYRFVVVRQYNWDAAFAVLLVDEQRYSLLEENDLIVEEF
ncbi:MAG: hypothetical protein IT258_20145 [Saprospiraceae bacterium]|nr:hypothetical protein [Saprospiraceae bacterium]